MSNTKNNNNLKEKEWSVETYYSSAESSATPKLEELSATTHWALNSVCGLLAMCLLIAAAARATKGDALGSVLSSIGAILCALSPIIAKQLLEGV